MKNGSRPVTREDEKRNRPPGSVEANRLKMAKAGFCLHLKLKMNTIQDMPDRSGKPLLFRIRYGVGVQPIW